MPSEIKRILTVTLEVELNDRRMSDRRMREAFEKATSLAACAVADTLLDGSVSGVRGSFTYDYRHAEHSEEEFKPLDQFDWKAELQAA